MLNVFKKFTFNVAEKEEKIYISWKVCLVFLAIAIVRIFFYSTLTVAYMTPDSSSYDTEGENLFVNGICPSYAPIYPILIYFLKIIFASHYKIMLCLIQAICSFIALIFLYKTLQLLFNKKLLSLVLVAIYGTSITLMGWDFTMLTESLSLSIVVFVLYYMVKFIKYKKLSYGITSLIISFALMFLKPACLILFAVILVLVLVLSLYYKNKKSFIKVAIVSLFSLLVMSGYMGYFNGQYGHFSIANSMPRQMLYIVIDDELYINYTGEYEGIQKIIIEQKELGVENGWEIRAVISETYDTASIKEFATQCIMQNKIEYIKGRLKAVAVNADENFESYYESNQKSGFINRVIALFNKAVNFITTKISVVKLATIYLLAIYEFVVALVLWIKKKKPPMFRILMFCVLASGLLMAFLGTNAEYARTVIYVLPFALVSIACLIIDITKLVFTNCKSINDIDYENVELNKDVQIIDSSKIE